MIISHLKTAHPIKLPKPSPLSLPQETHPHLVASFFPFATSQDTRRYRGERSGAFSSIGASLSRPQPREKSSHHSGPPKTKSQDRAPWWHQRQRRREPAGGGRVESRRTPAGRRLPGDLEMGILCFGASSTLLCGEDSNSVLGLGGGGDGEAAEAGAGLGFLDVGAVFPVDGDEVMRVLVEKEADHRPKGGYVERLGHGGFESSWRKDAMDWICKVHSHYNFGPLSLCLSVNYMDRFLSSFDLPHDKSWMQQLMSVACLSLAVKMEETVAPLPVDLQVCDASYEFEPRNIKRMELIVMETLKWRMHSVTPFSFLCYFLDKFNQGKPPSYMLVSRCAELIVATVKDYRFLSFRPSEIAAAVVLWALTENQVIGFSSTLAASEIPVNKEMIARCYELLVKKRGNFSASLSAPLSPIGVLDVACFSFRNDDEGHAPSNNNSSNNDQASTPASKRRRLSTSPI